MSARAERDLEAITDYISQSDAKAALTYVRELRAAVKRLALTPLGFPLVGRGKGGIRRRSFRSHIIFYRVDVSVLHVLGVIHRARNFDPSVL